ncbi:proteinase-activated receptor 1-like [Saccostrea cucullata]|uniref:proteinase-activated receptor 1-like n=1 Tax=Saccostrea cuccullata TaxID=36930 RepID=UPI002ED0ACE4
MAKNDLLHLIVSFPALVINIIALAVLMRSRKLPFQIRILALNLCLADCGSCLTLCIDRRVFELIFGTNRVKYFFLVLFGQSSLVFITLFNVDRFLAIKFAMQYYSYLSPTKVKSACILSWVFGPLITSFQFCTLVWSDFCSSLNYTLCTRISQYGYFAIYTSNFILFGYIIYGIKRKVCKIQPMDQADHKKDLTSQATGQKTFRKIAVITGSFLGLYAPGMTWTLIKPYVSNLKIANYMNMSTGILFTVSTILDPIFYVLRFSECRFQLFLLRYMCDASKYEETMMDRNQHYAPFTIVNPTMQELRHNKTRDCVTP